MTVEAPAFAGILVTGYLMLVGGERKSRYCEVTDQSFILIKKLKFLYNKLSIKNYYIKTGDTTIE
jgi:hypothetical protein